MPAQFKNTRENPLLDSTSNYQLPSQNNVRCSFGNRLCICSDGYSTTDLFDLATFSKDGQEMTAFYDFGGKLLGSAVNKSFTDLPLRGQNSITKTYKKYSVQSVTLYDFNNQSDFQMILSNGQYVDSKNYFVQMSDGKNKIVLQVDLAGQVYYLEKL